MKRTVVIEGVMKFIFSYEIETETAMEALDHGIERAKAYSIDVTKPETPTIFYHVKEVKETKEE